METALALKLDIEYEGHKVRMGGTQDRPEWIAADVCEVLGIQNSRQAVQNFKETERGVCQIYTNAGARETITVTEAGLYRLILRSDKPEAERFRDWVTHEVLPSI